MMMVSIIMWMTFITMMFMVVVALISPDLMWSFMFTWTNSTSVRLPSPSRSIFLQEVVMRSLSLSFKANDDDHYHHYYHYLKTTLKIVIINLMLLNDPLAIWHIDDTLSCGVDIFCYIEYWPIDKLPYSHFVICTNRYTRRVLCVLLTFALNWHWLVGLLVY